MCINKVSILLILLSFPVILFNYCHIDAQQGQQYLGAENITLYDPNLKIELVASGLDFPTTMAFLGPDDFLILEKNTGNVKRVINGTLVEKPLLHVVSSIKDERGLLGIAISEKNKNDYKNVLTVPNKDVTHNVFLYYIGCKDVVKNTGCENRVFRYDLDNKNNVLINPKFLVGVPSFPDPSHIGGIIKIGPDENLYVTVGNFQNTIPSKIYKTKTQNYEDGEPVDGRAGILRLTQDGYPVLNADGTAGIIGNKYPLNAYYAYGIRNSFGIDFDPVTGKLWDTENGPQFGDEINMVEPGFNSGSDRVYGIWEANDVGDMLKNKKGEPIIVGNNPQNLVDFNGKGHYSPPEFIWIKTIGPTALSFLDSDKLGSNYKDDIFVGSADGGYLFHFKPNNARDGLVLKGNLTDKIAYNRSDYDDILLGEGFSIITDVKQGPDGYLYVVSGLKQSKTAKFGAVFRIMPKEVINNNTKSDNITIQQEYTKTNNDDNKIKYNTTALTNFNTKTENVPKKMDTNILSAIAPKLSNTTKIIDTKAWDNLFKRN
ncbi:MAG TPA: PQQ-dependent sugar dehydrogenase [Nitrososphaeraceae archaeon]|nr:PQQ-dependent sugar dehydrogenase [Nitrososphaeraceae archaeon]